MKNSQHKIIYRCLFVTLNIIFVGFLILLFTGYSLYFSWLTLASVLYSPFFKSNILLALLFILISVSYWAYLLFYLMVLSSYKVYKLQQYRRAILLNLPALICFVIFIVSFIITLPEIQTIH